MSRLPVDPPFFEQGALRQPDGGVAWHIWAPRHQKLELVLHTEGPPRAHLMKPAGNGFFTYRARGVREGQRYIYRLDGEGEFPDPASRWQPDGVHTPSAVFFPQDFRWTDSGWRGVPRGELVIYELHTGTFTREGTFEAIIPRLAELRELGVTAIEIMPVAQFPGSRNWGYDGVYPFAVQQSYGGPRALQRLVDAAHAAGLAVILDVVYNHLGPEGNYFSRFGHYFADYHHTPWGRALNYDRAFSDPVRHFVLDNVRMWIRDFHFDGLRLDAAQEIYDLGTRHLLSEIAAVAHEAGEKQGRTTHVIAETNQEDLRLVNPPALGGYGLDGVWSDDFHHSVHALLTGERDGYYQDYGQPEHLAKSFNDVFVLDGCYSHYRQRRHGMPAGDAPRDRFVICLQNHDQVGNRAESDRFGALLSMAEQRLAAALLLIAPGVPMLFMGEEYGEQRPFPFFCSFEDRGLVEAVRRGRAAEFAGHTFRWSKEPLDPQALSTFEAAKLTWSWPAGSEAAGLRALYRDLLSARRTWPALRDIAPTTARVVSGDGGDRRGADDGPPPLLIVRRGAQPALLAVANLSKSRQACPDVAGELADILGELPTAVLSTAQSCYAGERTSLDEVSVLEPFELVIWGPQSWRPR
ncbi:MAG: malto-oligosyltrehalose trehalohydrolase [Pirellulales bacterium]|nr:malto-oligosyltrehalose trehalohydrolase [Pirellulales bacterium]